MDRFLQLAKPLLLAALVTLLLVQPAWACPTCKNGMADNSSLVAGYQWSILFMMSMPFTILGLFATYMYWEVCRARARQAAEAEQAATAESESPPEPVTAGR